MELYAFLKWRGLLEHPVYSEILLDTNESSRSLNIGLTIFIFFDDGCNA